MKKMTWKFKDRSEWESGPWDDEPDKMQWVDQRSKMPCLAVRNYAGAWCGYVAVTSDHPLYGVPYDECPSFNVHGGLTFSGFCATQDKEHGICHIVEPGEDDKVWWFGFDCHHYQDDAPGYSNINEKAEYRTLEYVRDECAQLAAQL